MWNEHFSRPDYVYGTEPNGFLASCAELFDVGQTALCIADGEGRNSVWLAAQGLNVTAFDASEVGLDKAKRLADEKDAAVDYHLADIEHWDWAPDRFDVVAAIFIQFAPPDLRTRIFAGMKRTLRPGGLIVMQGYGHRQIEYGTGGPGKPEHLYTRELLEAAFSDFEIVRLTEHDGELHEGPGHSGMSALIDLVARRPG